MSVKIATLLFTCDLCGIQATAPKIPSGWEGYQFPDEKARVYHQCEECISCFSLWKESRIQARADEAKLVQKAKAIPTLASKPKTPGKAKVKR